jgi:hypothetical protein
MVNNVVDVDGRPQQTWTPYIWLPLREQVAYAMSIVDDVDEFKKCMGVCCGSLMPARFVEGVKAAAAAEVARRLRVVWDKLLLLPDGADVSACRAEFHAIMNISLRGERDGRLDWNTTHVPKTCPKYFQSFMYTRHDKDAAEMMYLGGVIRRQHDVRSRPLQPWYVTGF